MQRKPGFPVANCNIKMPDNVPPPDTAPVEDDSEHQRRRQQLINFAHSQWGFNNWSWTVNKQDLDFVDFSNGKYAAGVVSFVTVTVKSFDIHRENIGYATSTAHMKGLAIYQARKSAVTNALRETLLSFGGSVATELMELLGNNKIDEQPHIAEQTIENNQNVINKMPLNEPKNIQKSPEAVRRPVKNSVPVSKPTPSLPPANKAPAAVGTTQPPVGNQPRPQRPNSNVSFVLQPVMGGMIPQMLPPHPPRLPPPPMYHNYYDYAPYFYDNFERHHNFNVNFNIPPKNIMLNRGIECKNSCVRPPQLEGDPIQYGQSSQNPGCWIKPTIFYDGFWTEQKVKKWVTEQVEKQFPDEIQQKPVSPGHVEANNKV